VDSYRRYASRDADRAVDQPAEGDRSARPVGPVECLATLAAEIRALPKQPLRARLVQGAGHTYLRVVHSKVPDLVENISCRRRDNLASAGGLAFAWSWNEWINPADRPREAAATIGRVLRVVQR
jgi:hypothetical protein